MAVTVRWIEDAWEALCADLHASGTGGTPDGAAAVLREHVELLAAELDDKNGLTAGARELGAAVRHYFTGSG